MPNIIEVKQLFIANIEEGYYDKDLKILARAIFNRKNVIDGLPPEPIRKAPAPDNTTNTVEPVEPIDKPMKKDYYRKAKSKVFVNPEPLPSTVLKMTPKHVQSTTPAMMITFNGNHYLKSQFVGKSFALPATMRLKLLRGVMVVITGIGDNKVKAMFIDKPRQKKGQWIDYYKEHEEFFVHRNVINKVLQP